MKIKLMKTKEEIINEIRQVFDSLSDDISAGIIEGRGEKILGLLSEMETLEPGSTGDAIDALYHTLNKEVGYAKDAERAMNKKNAANKRGNEYRESMRKAILRIHSDLWMIIRREQ